MTPDIEKKRRELYESHVVLPDTVQWDEGTKSYTGANFWLAQFGWDAFNAALDAVEIELPNTIAFEHEWGTGARAVTLDESEHDDSETAYSLVRRIEVREAITATGLGLKVKP